MSADDAFDYIDLLVRGGFYTSTEIVELVSRSKSYREFVRTHNVPKLVTQHIAEYEREQATWEYPTDCDRLDNAFEEFNQKGIVARQNFSCCGTCGSGEIEEIAEEQRKHRYVRGTVFYHVQTTELAVNGYGVYLYFAAMIDDEQEHRRLGRVIIEILERAGLATEWDDDPQKAIHIRMDWKRRFRRN
ncbi:MAG: hypothetical protein KF726_16835 [Anaerolineae bacterium]|nr:hypothetical protein [Anaerolineae bacterium]